METIEITLKEGISEIANAKKTYKPGKFYTITKDQYDKSIMDIVGKQCKPDKTVKVNSLVSKASPKIAKKVTKKKVVDKKRKTQQKNTITKSTI